MNKNKGFTLVELLGVVVVLVMILLIAIPTINRLRDETKRKAFENSAYGIIKAGDLYYSRKEMMGEELEDTLFEFPNNIGELEFSGDIPKNGSMIVTDSGEIGLAISNGKYCITKEFNSSDVKVTKNVDDCNFRINKLSLMATTETGVSIPTCVTNKTTCAAGEKVAIKVNDTDVYNFYVISDDGSKLTLIMDRDLGNNVAWYVDARDNRYGPVTALNYLNSQTANWDNIVPIKIYTYDNNLNGTTKTYGYQKLEIENGLGRLTSEDGTTIIEVEGISRARLLTYVEAKAIEDANNGTMPTYLYGEANYWTSTANSSVPVHAWYMGVDGNLYSSNVNTVSGHGVRPVIELSK